MSSVFEKALSLEWNGKVFILTIRNEITANTTVAGNTFLYSYDGKSWLPSSNITTSSLSNTNPYNVKWTGQKYLMETSTNINQSSDGLNWSAVNTTFPVKPNLTLANFSTLSPTNLSDTNIALSGDGTMVVVSKYASGSTIYYSTYSGSAWSALTSTGISTAGGGWKGISLSYTGSPMLISGSENSLYILSAGTWIKSAVFSPSDTQGSALSQDGTRAVFAFYSGGFGFFSYSGSSWSSQTSVTINTTTYPSATYANFKGIGMNLQGTTVVLYATSNSSFFYSNYNGSTWSALTLILTSTVVPPMNLNNGIEIDFWNNIYIGGYGSRYVFYSAYNAKAVGNKWSEFSTIIDASYNPIGFSVSENGWMAIAASNGNAYVYDNIVSGIYDVEVNLEQTNTISFPQNTTLALGGVLADSTKIAYSTDSGLTWTPAQSSASVFSTSCNNATWNGKIWVAVGSGGNTIATSPDGRTWTGRGSYIFTTQGNAVEWSKELCLWVAVGQGTNSIAYSTDGIYWFSALVASSQGLTSGTDIKWNSRTWVATGTSSLIGIFTSVDGQNWTQVPLLNIGLPPVTNYGGTWTQTTQTPNTWLVNAMNYTGQYQTAVDASGAIYISSNFGAAWSYSQFTLPSFVQPLVAFLAINSSGSQQYLLVGGGGLWISSNYGATWSYNNTFPINSNWTSVATDSIGLNVLASSASSVGASAGLWLSTNSGGAWAQIGSYSNIPFNGCTVSATGQYMSAIDIYGGIYISSNYGRTWTISVAGSGFVVPTEIAGSSSGQYLTTCNYGTNTYTVDAYYTMLSSATNGAMDTAGNIYMGGSQSVPSQVIYKISSSSVVTPVGNVGVYINQNFAIAIDNTNGFLYFIGVSGPTIYKTVIATGTTTAITALNTSLNGVSTATPSGIVCNSTGNLYILTSSVAGTTAYVCSYTTGSVFSTIITQTVTTGGLALGIDKSNNIYLSYPNQVDQYSTAGALLAAGFYNSGRLVKYMTFDTTGNGYFYDVSGVYKVTLGQSTTYPVTQTFISGTTTNAYQIVQDSVGNFYISNGVNNTGNTILQYSPTGSLLNASFISGSKPVGIAFDKFNNLYVVNAGTNNVSQYKITNGAITTTNTTFITTGLSTPWACTFDNNGNFYVTNYGASATTGFICKYTMSNTSTNTITGTNTTFVTGISNPWTITCDSANNIYYSEIGTNNIKKYSTGSVLTTVMSGFLVGIDANNTLYVQGTTSVSKYSTSGSLITANYITGLNIPQTFWFDASQNIYIQNAGTAITKTSVISNSTIITGLSSPQYTAVDSYGAVYTTNSTAGTVTKYGPVSLTFASTGMNGAEQVGFDNNGNIYVSNYGGTVSQYNSAGTLLNANFITGGSACIGMVLDSQNNIYLVNRPTGTTGYIAKYVTSNGSLSSSNTSFITSLSGPQALVIDTNNNLYISQANNYGTTAGFISKYTTTGTVVTASFISSLNNPNQMAFDSYGNIYIALTGGNYIAKYSYNGTVISSTFISFSIPMGLVIDSYNNIYVSQYSTTNTGFASKYSPTGILISSGYGGITGLNLNYLSLDSSNNLYAVNASNIVYKVTNTNQTIISGLNQMIPYGGINNITISNTPTQCWIDNSYNIYVCNNQSGTVSQYLYNFNYKYAINIAYGLTSPNYVTTDAANNLYVMSSTGGVISKYIRNATYNSNKNNVIALCGGLYNRNFMNIDNSNNIYIIIGITIMQIDTNFNINNTNVFSNILHSGTAYTGNNNDSNYQYSNGKQLIQDLNGFYYIVFFMKTSNTFNIVQFNSNKIPINNTFFVGTASYSPEFIFDNSNNLYVGLYNGSSSYNINRYVVTNGIIQSTISNFITIPITSYYYSNMAVDPNNNLYVSMTSTTTVYQYIINNTTIVSSNTSFITGVAFPMGMVFNSNSLYLCITTGVNKYTISSNIITNTSNFITGLNTSINIVADSSNNFYVSSYPNIKKYNSSGILLNTFSGLVTSAAYVSYIDSSNNYYVLCGKYPVTLIKFNFVTNTSSIIIKETTNTNFDLCSGLAIDNNGNIYITSQNYQQIGLYNSTGTLLNGTFVPSITSPNGLGGSFKGCCVDNANNFYVTDFYGCQVLKFIKSGNSATFSIRYYVANLNFNTCTYNTSNGYIYAGGNGTIYVLNSSFALITTYTGFTNIRCIVFNNNNMYVGDGNGYYVYNSSFTQVSYTGIPNGGINGLSVDSNSNVYVTVFNINDIILLPYTNTSSSNTSFITGLTSPQSIVFDSTNNLYITTGSAVAKYNSTGTLTSASYITGLTSPKGLTIDSANNIYVTSGSTVQKFNSSGALITSTYLQNLSSPIGLTIDSVNNLYVVQNGSNTVNRYNNNILLSQTVINASSNTLTAFLPTSYGFSTNPTNLFNIDSANNLYLSAPYPSNSFVIYKYSSSTLSTYYANAATPYLANDASYNLYWTTTANTVVKFNPYTKSQTTYIDISGSQQGVSVLQAPQGLTFDIAQNLYLCCSGNIIKVAQGTKAVYTFATIAATYAIIADSSSNIYAMAATTPSHTVYKITQAGVQTTFFDSTKGLYSGYGLTIDAPGNIYIGSVNQAQTQTVIYKISPQGTQTTVYTTSTVNPVLGYAPLSVDKYGNLYLYDNNQIIVINPNGNSSTISNVSTLPTSFAFDNTNTIYMTDTSYNTSLNTITLGNTVLNTSSNYGATWTAGSLQNITAIANAGLYQSVIANGQIYISSNYGSSFATASGLGFSNIKSVALSQNSSSGYFQTGIQSTGNIYTSNQVSYNNITKVLWNGTYWTGVISGNTNPIMTSTNGISWANLPGNPFSGNIIQNGFYSSRTGQTLFIGSYTGSVTVPIYTSTTTNTQVTTPITNFIPTLNQATSTTISGQANAAQNGTYIVSSSSNLGGNYNNYQAFAYTVANNYYWCNGTTGATTTVGGSSIGGEWLQIQLPTAVQMTSFSMPPVYNSPQAMVVAGSNDGTTWTNVTTIASTGLANTGVGSIPSNAVSVTYNTTTNTNYYTYFRFIVTTAGGQSNIGKLNINTTIQTGSITTTNAFGNTTTQNSITTLYNTSNNINSISNVVLPSISNTISITQNTRQPISNDYVLGAWNISPWSMSSFPDTTALWIYNIPGAASTAPANQSSPIIFQYTYNNTTKNSISANVYIVVDNYTSFYVNGLQYGGFINGGWPNAATNIAITIAPGNNLFQFPVVNDGTSGNSAGLLVTVIANSVVLFNSNASWTYQNASIGSPNAITYNGTYYLLGGNAVASSPDTRTWTYGSAISGMSQINNFAWNNPDQGSASIAPLSVAVGKGSNTIAYSIDGIYWQGTGNSVFTVQGNKAVWNGKLWCAVGMGGYWVATSYDGIVWTGRDNYWMQQGYDIVWNGQIFIAVGYGLVTMAASADGVNWQGIVRTPLDIYASSITWTGKIWLAYGAGATTSTAYSNQVLGTGWQTTPQPSIAIQNAQTVFSPSYFTSSTLTGYSATASSEQIGYESYRGFDDKFSATTGQLTSWFSAAGTYAAATGQYLGSQTTSYNGGSVTGEWLQVQLPKPTPVIYYYIVFTIDTSNTSIPTGWTLLGSQTGTSWTLIENFSFSPQTTPPNNTNGYPFLVIPRNIINTGAAYQYYRIIIPAIFGGGSQNYAKIAEFDLYSATSGSNQLSPITRPIVTKTHVLHPTNLLYMQGVGYQTFYIATDLNGNQINNYYLNQAGYANTAVYGLGASPTVAQTFDGQNYLVLANSGAATYLSNQAANTTLNFSPTYNGTTIQTNLTQAYAAAYNKRSILLGGANGQIGSITYATLGTGSSPIFKPTNASVLFTAVYGLASNSGYGPVYIPNAIYMKPQDKISIIGPKAYPSAISNTSITMNLTNAQILTNITNSLNSISIYGETGPIGDIGAVGTQGAIVVGPIGWLGQKGDIGQIADSGAQGQIGYFGLVGPTGPSAPYWQVLGNSISYPYLIGVNNSTPVYTLDISGTTNTSNIIMDSGQVLQNIRVGGGLSSIQTQVDISGSAVVSNSMIIGTMNTPPSGGLLVSGSQNISNISYLNQIAENLAQGAPDSTGNLLLDLSQPGGVWVLDMSNCPNNITCQINNIPSILGNGIIYLTVYLDYSQAVSLGGYYISSVVVGSQTYSLLFRGGSPPTTTGLIYIKQDIQIWIANSQIVRILSTI